MLVRGRREWEEKRMRRHQRVVLSTSPVYNVQLYASFVAIWVAILGAAVYGGGGVRLHHRKSSRWVWDTGKAVVKCKACFTPFCLPHPGTRRECKFLRLRPSINPCMFAWVSLTFDSLVGDICISLPSSDPIIAVGILSAAETRDSFGFIKVMIFYLQIVMLCEMIYWYYMHGRRQTEVSSRRGRVRRPRGGNLSANHAKEKPRKGQDTEKKKRLLALESYVSVPSTVFQFRLSSQRRFLSEDLKETNGMEEKHVSAQAKRDHVRSEVE